MTKMLMTFVPVRSALFLTNALFFSHLAVQVSGQQSNCNNDFNSTFHCRDPAVANAIWEDDPTVSCDTFNCQWETNLLLETQKPIHCINVEIIRASDPVSDFLEPCLLWELMYGEFAPTAAPTLSMHPTSSPRPSAAPTSVPTTATPTFTPTTVPTSLPTGVPTLYPTAFVVTSSPIVQPTIAPTVVSTPTASLPPAIPEDSPAQTVARNFNSVLLTYLFPNKSGANRQNLRSLSALTMSSRAELYYLTEAHMKNVIPNLERLRLILTPYQEVPLDNGNIAVTEMLQGSLTLEVAPEQLDSLDVDGMIGAAFSGNPLSTYLNSLRMSSDPVLNSLSDVTYGIPPGIPDTVANGARSARQGNSSGSSMSGLWIGIMVCGIVGLCGVVVAGYFMISRNPEGFAGALGLKFTNTGSFSHGSPTSSMEPQLIRRMQSVDHDSPGGQGHEVRLEDDELPEGTQGGDVTFGDMQSEITSVYSYVDRTGLNESIMTDDQSYSLAPSFLVRKSNAQGEDSSPGLTSPENERNGSVMWSVMDGLGDQSLAYKSPVNNGDNKLTVENSPSRLVISATRPQADENELYIFNDDVSLVSETSASKITQVDTVDGRTASPGNDSFRSSIDGSLIKSVITRAKSMDSFHAVSPQQQKEQQKPEPQQDAADEKEDIDKPTELRISLASVLRPKQNKPLSDLSHVTETSEVSRNTSRASLDDPSSAPSSAAKSRKSAKLDRSKNESTDDDSSLFMGPDSFSKENLPGNSKLLSLGEENKVTPSDEKSFNITPLYRSSARLSDKDKEHLGILRTASKDELSLAESMKYPDSYALADFRDDMSISTHGSRPRTKYGVSTMASF